VWHWGSLKIWCVSLVLTQSILVCMFLRPTIGNLAIRQASNIWILLRSLQSQVVLPPLSSGERTLWFFCGFAELRNKVHQAPELIRTRSAR